jgi:hypothetical protein
VPIFLEQLSSDAPIGYVVFDLDYYSSTREALNVLTADDPTKYLPVTLAYFDDISLYSHNRWCGELLAIDEFNLADSMRKITQDAFLADRRLYRRAAWIKKMFSVHVLDSPVRNSPALRGRAVIENPYL